MDLNQANSLSASLPLAKSLTVNEDKLWSLISDKYSTVLSSLPTELQQHLRRCCLLSPFISDCILVEGEFVIRGVRDNWQGELPWDLWQQALADQMSACTNDLAAKQILRRWRSRIWALIGIRHVMQSTLIQRECGDIAKASDLLINSAYQWLLPHHCLQWGEPKNARGQRQDMLIVAMGKYGGYELNYSSDVDLLFFYVDDGETTGGRRSLEHQTFYVRLGQQLIALLADNTRDGFVFRVDMRLRPYGDSGPLAMSFAAAEDYYQEQGREWERFAMIKARVINGYAEEQQEFYQLIRPFVYRRYIDFGVLESIRDMKKMIETEVRRKGLTNNIKLGSGGIREAEFIVQSLQLIRGGRLTELQEPSFAKAMSLLADNEIIESAMAQKILNDYWFLRRIEHMLQIMHNQQTQFLPENELDQLRLVNALGYDDWPPFENQLKQSMSRIASEFKAVFRVDEHEGGGDDSANTFSLDMLAEEDVAQWFKQADQQQINEISKRLQSFTDSLQFQQLTTRGRERMEALLPVLMEVIAQQENAIETLARVLNLLSAITRRTAYLVLLTENPPVLEHLVKLCGQSEWIAHRLAEFPILLDELLYPNHLYKPLSQENLQQQLHQQMLRIEPDDEEQQQEQLRIFKQINELRVAAAVLNKTFNVRKASRFLSQIAQSILSVVTLLSWKKLCGRYGVPNIEGASREVLKGFSVVAYGKFGGEELGFGSDLDIVFLYNAEPEQPTQGEKSMTHSLFFTRLAQRIINTLNMRTISGVLYEVDTRLRPSGNSGLLVSHIDAFQDYQLYEAWTWEHQAITRARGVAGDEFLIQWFDGFRHHILRQQRESDKLKQDVLEMREKMRSNLDRSSNDLLDIKQMPGGMVDIEFIAQYLVLLHAARFPEQHWTCRTTRQFILLNELRVLPNPVVADLIEAYRDYREKTNILILTGQEKRLQQSLVEGNRAKVLQHWKSIFES